MFRSTKEADQDELQGRQVAAAFGNIFAIIGLVGFLPGSWQNGFHPGMLTTSLILCGIAGLFMWTAWSD